MTGNVPPEKPAGVLTVGAGPVDPPALRALSKVGNVPTDVLRNPVLDIIPLDLLQDQIAPQASAEKPLRRRTKAEPFDDLPDLPWNAVRCDDEDTAAELPFGHVPFSRQDNPTLLPGTAQKPPVRFAAFAFRVIAQHAHPCDQPSQIGIGSEAQLGLVFFR